MCRIEDSFVADLFYTRLASIEVGIMMSMCRLLFWNNMKTYIAMVVFASMVIPSLSQENRAVIENEVQNRDTRFKYPVNKSFGLIPPDTVKALQKVLKKEELLIRFLINSNNSYAFLISKNQSNIIPLKVREKEIHNTIETYLLGIKEHNASHIKRYGKILYRGLLQSLENYISGHKDIIIIPDGGLKRIPFEALSSGRRLRGAPEFFLKKYRIKYIQSASILTLIRNQYRRDRGIKSFVGFGDPVYDYESYSRGNPEKVSATRNDKTKLFARTGDKLNRLPASGQEVKIIGMLFKKQSYKSILYPRNLATEDNAKADYIKDFDCIHFACHGLFNGYFQSLVLSQDVPGCKEDGYFTFNEIMNCDYNASLVVFSACRTGWGKVEPGEGITGLTQAVMCAGTPCVVTSLWDVDDNATKDLMIHFYRNILEKNMSKVEALRQAKLELMKDERYRSPIFWSGFVMYGE